MCSRDHTALKLDSAAWRSLEWVGVQRFDGHDGEPPLVLELRNCTCGSTLAIEITPDHPVPHVCVDGTA